MKNVKLKVVRTGSPYIEAPEFCPYKFELTQIPPCEYFSDGSGYFPLSAEVIIPDRYQVNSSICSVCKYCTFIPEIMEDVEIVDVQKFIKYLTEFNSKLNYSITRQLGYLIKEERQPLSILISAEVCQQMLQYCFSTDLITQQKLLSQYSISQTKLCEIHGLPVYISIKLTKSPVMVIGEIEWK